MEFTQKKGVLLINLGTPKSPSPKDVFHYLNEFLTDARVIDIPYFKRQLLVRGVIVPFRFKASSLSYQAIWQKEGSPLSIYAKQTKELLQTELGDGYHVEYAMRYQEPSIHEALKKLEKMDLKELTIIPLFPQYASATTGSICEKVFSCLSSWSTFPKIKIINSFFNHPLLIDAFCEIAKESCYRDYEHILMSFHGLPKKHLIKADKHSSCQKKQDCCKTLCEKNLSCYGAQCYATADLIAKQLNLDPSKYTVCFQSRLGKTPWIMPYTSNVIEDLAKKGVKNILVMCPAFICDCLETLHEIAFEYEEEFKNLGGKSLTLMPGLNTHPLWIQTLKELVIQKASELEPALS